MAEDNISSAAVNFIMLGLLILSLVTFMTTFINNEGRGEVFADYPEIERLQLNSSQIVGAKVINETNNNINLSIDYNTELAFSGGDQTANAFSINLFQIIEISLISLSILGSLIFGNIYLTLLSGVVSAIAFIYATRLFNKFIRTGQ